MERVEREGLGTGTNKQGECNSTRYKLSVAIGRESRVYLGRGEPVPSTAKGKGKVGCNQPSRLLHNPIYNVPRLERNLPRPLKFFSPAKTDKKPNGCSFRYTLNLQRINNGKRLREVIERDN